MLTISSYRLGAPGFLTSEELRNAGFKANNVLRDQRVALQWVHRHIRDFGGNPDNITAAGMSAGGGKYKIWQLCYRKSHFRLIISSFGHLPSSFQGTSLQTCDFNERNISTQQGNDIRGT